MGSSSKAGPSSTDGAKQPTAPAGKKDDAAGGSRPKAPRKASLKGSSGSPKQAQAKQGQPSEKEGEKKEGTSEKEGNAVASKVDLKPSELPSATAAMLGQKVKHDPVTRTKSRQEVMADEMVDEDLENELLNQFLVINEFCNSVAMADFDLDERAGNKGKVDEWEEWKAKKEEPEPSSSSRTAGSASGSTDAKKKGFQMKQRSNIQQLTSKLRDTDQIVTKVLSNGKGSGKGKGDSGGGAAERP